MQQKVKSGEELLEQFTKSHKVLLEFAFGLPMGEGYNLLVVAKEAEDENEEELLKKLPPAAADHLRAQGWGRQKEGK